MAKAFVAAALTVALFTAGATAQTEAFHNGDHVLITPYGGAWAECTLTSERLGYANDYSYMAVCAPMTRTSTPDSRPHQYSEERVKSVDDPVAVAGIRQQQAISGPSGPMPGLPQQPAYRPQFPQAAATPAYQQQFPQVRQNQGPAAQPQMHPSPLPPAGDGPPGMGPPPPMDAPARPGYGPAQ